MDERGEIDRKVYKPRYDVTLQKQARDHERRLAGIDEEEIRDLHAKIGEIAVANDFLS